MEHAAPHIEYVIAAYGFAGIVLLALVLHTFMRSRATRRDKPHG